MKRAQSAPIPSVERVNCMCVQLHLHSDYLYLNFLCVFFNCFLLSVFAFLAQLLSMVFFYLFTDSHVHFQLSSSVEVLAGAVITAKQETNVVHYKEVFC